MNRFRRSRMISTRFGFFALFFALTFMTGIISGCATQQQVRQIVNESNKALMNATMESNASLVAAMMPGSEGLDTMPVADSETDTKQQPWVVPSAKIDTFIETHPDQKVTASTLRVRQAMLLLAYKQYNLARAAFDTVDPQYLTNARDRALYDLRGPLVWWFRASKLDTLSLPEFQEADSALKSFQTKINTLADSPGIRDYLAEMRVWIALYAARKITNQAKAEAYIENGIDNYAKIFTDQDLTALKTGSDSAGWNVSMVDIRRRLRAKPVIDYAKDVIKRQRIEPEFESPVFNQLLKVSP